MPFKNYVTLIIVFAFSFSFAQTNTPPTLTATGDQYYCPLSPMNVATDFNIVDPDDTEIEAIYIQISSGYVSSEDTLVLTGSHPNISSSWSSSEGKLTLNSSSGGNALYTDLIAAVKDVVFESSSVNPSSDKSFSITIGDANYLPSTGHFYEYVADLGITWTDARTEAENRTYYGLQGYLATISSAEEAQLSGEQAAGAGWIGGSDSETEGVWKWMTGPEAGTIFWNGTSSGSTPNYANWNTNEPNNLGGEDYAHVTAPGVGTTGSWNDLSNTGDTNSSSDYHPKGYIVEYGGTAGDPTLNISASTTIKMTAITSVLGDNTCDSGSVTLTATSNNGDVLWFDSVSSTTPIGSGNSFTTPNLTTTKTYYALASANGCTTGIRSGVTATIYTTPTITSTTDAIICESDSGVLLATASSGTINWYDAATGGNLLSENSNSFTTPTLITTTTYYVEALENGCVTSTRTAVTATVQNTSAPTGNTTQTFCDIENATIADLNVTGTNIQWYTTATGGTVLNSSETLNNATTYYASQTENTCESSSRLAVEVTIYKTVTTLTNTEIPILQTCDTNDDSDDTNGISEFDLTLNETTLLNGESISDFDIYYFEDDSYISTSEITNPSAYINTTANNQTIYVRIENKLDTSCYSETSFDIEVTSLPVIITPVILKNCDEDGNPDGYTDYNLDEASSLITNGDTNLTVTYYLSATEAETGTNSVSTSPFNNASTVTPNIVYARVENLNGCYRIGTVELQVSTTSFPSGYMHEPLEVCDTDDTNDGFSTFDLTTVSNDFITLFPTATQTLSVHYYRNLDDAELEENEILPQDSYTNETAYSQNLYVRVESAANEECFGIGEVLTLEVQGRPEFEVDEEAIVCLNNTPLTIETYNALDTYTYEWSLDSNIVGTGETLDIYTGGTYSVVAYSTAGCVSFEKTITVSESNTASITLEDITVTDDSNNNSITIDNTNLGIGDYEFSLDDEDFDYQDDPYFDNVSAGIHTIYVRDKNNCGTTSIEVSVIGFPKFFTPNNDGYNDTWSILGVSSEFFESSQVYIFDRFGKLIAQFDTINDDNGWNGMYNGKILTSTDYWFKAQLIDFEGNIRVKSGHFSLIRH